MKKREGVETDFVYRGRGCKRGVRYSESVLSPRGGIYSGRRRGAEVEGARCDAAKRSPGWKGRKEGRKEEKRRPARGRKTNDAPRDGFEQSINNEQGSKK